MCYYESPRQRLFIKKDDSQGTLSGQKSVLKGITMAFDGIVIAALVKELGETLEGGRINRISMPEKNELLITIKGRTGQKRLLISAEASLPLLYLTEENKPAPLTAPGFCMLLRKHIGSGRIKEISQPGLERIVRIRTEQLNELGDLTEKSLIIELMGKYSNIIFTDEKDMILDAIKHIPSSLSSLREVLPGRIWHLPEQLVKKDPLTLTDAEAFCEALRSAGSTPLEKAFSQVFSGISPVMASELILNAGAEGRMEARAVDDTGMQRLYACFSELTERVRNGSFSPVMYLRNDVPAEFSALPLRSFEGGGYEERPYPSVSKLLSDYYAMRERTVRIRQKSADLRKLVQTILERSVRKYQLQEKQLKDTEKKEKFRIYGDLINTYGYQLSGGEKELVCENYYDENKEIHIPLDEMLTAAQNAKRYYDRYAKLKRTEEAVGEEIRKTARETEHLSSILTSLDLAADENDLNQIRDELSEYHFVRQRPDARKKQKTVSKPLHLVSSDGFDIYIGKNNYQNEEVSFKIASGNDWWFHAKGIPGSHVIVKANGQELPDRTFEEAASLAAWYSKGRDAEKVEIDYIQRKFLRKTQGGPPGFVIYHTNWSMMAKPAAEIPVKEHS